MWWRGPAAVGAGPAPRTAPAQVSGGSPRPPRPLTAPRGTLTARHCSAPTTAPFRRGDPPGRPSGRGRGGRDHAAARALGCRDISEVMGLAGSKSNPADSGGRGEKKGGAGAVSGLCKHPAAPTGPGPRAQDFPHYSLFQGIRSISPPAPALRPGVRVLSLERGRHGAPSTPITPSRAGRRGRGPGIRLLRPRAPRSRCRGLSPSLCRFGASRG